MRAASEDLDGAVPFPYAPALFCAACVGVAAWLFLTYSYARDVTPISFTLFTEFDWRRWTPSYERRPDHSMLGRYVTLRGRIRAVEPFESGRSPGAGEGGWLLAVPDAYFVVDVRLPASADPPHEAGEEAAFTGRVVPTERATSPRLWPGFMVDTTASRWTGESVAGIVVGAMGVLVFGMTFRHWLARRRASVGRAGEAKA